tara:strand:+ start:76493 stop:77257 length:765 start_codon:yes stop_codon:yes gene_type:complete
MNSKIAIKFRGSLSLLLLVACFSACSLTADGNRVIKMDKTASSASSITSSAQNTAKKNTNDKKYSATSVMVRPYYQHKKQRFESYQNNADIVMVGDSITDGAEWHEMFPEVSIVNRGISGDTTVGVLHRLQGITQTQAKKAFIMIGVNDFSRKRSAELVFANYKKIIAAIQQANIQVLVQSTLQTGISKKHHNLRVAQLNQLLKAYCTEQGITFIDLNKVLAPTGILEEKYSLDQLHLTAEGYALWQVEITPYM